MATETYLDRVQGDIRRSLERAREVGINGKLERSLGRAYKDTRKALGRTRSALEYHKEARQKTLRSFGSFPSWMKSIPKAKRHVAKQRGK